MKRAQRNDYLMLFCGLLLARDRKIPLKKALDVLPLSEGALRLVDHLTADELLARLPE